MSITDESKTRLLLHQSADTIGKSPSITPRQSWSRSAQSDWLSNFVTASNLSENLKNPPTSSPPPIPLPRTKFLSLPSEVAAFKDQQLRTVFENNQKELKRSESAPTANDVETSDQKDDSKINRFSSSQLPPVKESIYQQGEDAADCEEENETWL